MGFAEASHESLFKIQTNDGLGQRTHPDYPRHVFQAHPFVLTTLGMDSVVDIGTPEVTPYQYLCTTNKDITTCLLEEEWAGMDWETVAEMSPIDIRPSLVEGQQSMCYKVLAVLRRAIAVRNKTKASVAEALRAANDAVSARTGEAFARDAASPALGFAPVVGAASPTGPRAPACNVLTPSVQSLLALSSNRSMSAGSCASLKSRSSGSASSSSTRESCNVSSRLLYELQDVSDQDATEQVEYQYDSDNFPIFDPSNEVHVRHFRAGDFNPKQTLPSPPGVDPHKSGVAQKDTRQYQFSLIARDFSPPSLWTLDSRGDGSGYHKGTAHYERYILNTWVAGGGKLEHVKRRYRDRCVLKLFFFFYLPDSFGCLKWGFLFLSVRYQKAKITYGKLKARLERDDRRRRKQIDSSTPVHATGKASPPSVSQHSSPSTLANMHDRRAADVGQPTSPEIRAIPCTLEETDDNESNCSDNRPLSTYSYPSEVENKYDRDEAATRGGDATSGGKSGRRSDSDAHGGGTKRRKVGKQKQALCVRKPELSLKKNYVVVAAGQNREGGHIQLSGIVVKKVKNGHVKLWMCCSNDAGNVFRPSITSGNNPDFLKVPVWSIFHVYNQLLFNGNYDDPLIKGKVSSTEQAQVNSAYSNFDFDQL